ncbi:hypothetical protein PC115_g15128 [Phytophthora cactorum]|uniref:Kinesin motor domain-containing protein n=1 Tax=Phytophthora cactorum TaxID=29920 RepID=A0A8T1BN72_9STRA|nr:hypothetical protein PC115_g15128 [Phytophthora cactorum]
MQKKRVKVCIRVRPTTSKDFDATQSNDNVGTNDAVVIDEQQQTINVITNTASGGGTSFRFDQVLSPGIDQAGVFRWDADHSYALRMSYLEIYNDRLIDLLGPDVGTGHAPNDLAIQENARGQTVVRGLTKALVSSEEQALDLVFQGETNRVVAEHALNAASTRSHCIFTLYLERKRSVMSSALIGDNSMGGADPGAEALRDLEQAKMNLREAKAQYATLVLAVNRVKVEIDGYALQLQELRDRATPDHQKEAGEIEAQSMPLLQLQDAKKRYRAAFEQLHEKKAEVGYLGKIKAQMLQQVALQFQSWRDQQGKGPETAVTGEWPG